METAKDIEAPVEAGSEVDAGAGVGLASAWGSEAAGCSVPEASPHCTCAAGGVSAVAVSAHLSLPSGPRGFAVVTSP